MISFARPPYLLRKMYPKCVWRGDASTPKIYLTFDDGPVPEATPFVMEMLKQFQVKATFFCVGENVYKHPEIYSTLLQSGHQTGNHTFNHLKGFSTSNQNYFRNISACASYVKSNLFRPPYGQLRFSQQNYLAASYRLIMWDVLSYDYSSTVNQEKCLRNVIHHTRNGSIIVFHDSVKAFKNMSYALPRAIACLLEKGFQFELLS